MSDFQIRCATQHDFVTIIRLVHAMLSEMYALSSKTLINQGAAWQVFEARRAVRHSPNSLITRAVHHGVRATAHLPKSNPNDIDLLFTLRHNKSTLSFRSPSP
jgi:hypothetical protein